MKQLGDITKINGGEIEPVDVITGGSPCQDLSVAGKRAGLAGARSGLFMEQIRVIKKIRQHERDIGRADELIRPRYMVWENVPGAFSSNKGEDFRAVLEEICRVADSNADVPQPPNGKWANAGCIVGDGWSVAWRVHDAQFWGVPQRRRRIALVADFGGQSAPEILFERKGVSGDSAESRTAREGIARDAERGIDSASGVKCLNPSFPQSARIYDSSGVWHSLNANENGGQSRDAVLFEPKSAFEENWAESDVKNALHAEASKSSHAICIQGNCIDRADTAECNGKGWTEDVSYTLNTIDRPAVFDARGNGDGNISPTLTGDHQNRVTDYTAVCIGNGQANQGVDDKAGALNCMHDQQAIATFQNTGRGWWNQSSVAAGFSAGQGAAAGGIGYQEEIAPTLKAAESGSNMVPSIMCLMDQGGAQMSCTEGKTGTLRAQEHGHQPLVFENHGIDSRYTGPHDAVRSNMTVRRLTPLECERLQGYPDGWTDIGEWTDSKGKVHKPADSPRYKALGNSIALPFWFWMLKRMSAYLPAGATLGSLFDGIGGFPLCWEHIQGKGTARWASEIEEFPIAVTKLRFKEEPCKTKN